MSVAVRMQGVTKRFPGVLANNRVDFEVQAGEVHALLGENGAGKSTLMNILAGLYQPDEGTILLGEKRMDLASPADAIQAGIGMVHQHFALVETLTVTENVLLGLRSASFVVQRDRMRREILELSGRYGLNIDPDAYVWQISVGEQQRIEILKLLYRGAEVLILDEPTAVLTPQEAQELADILRQMTDEGKAVIFITHKLDEVMEFSQRVTVLRDGEVVDTVRTRDTSKSELARLMVGREVLFRVEKEPADPGPIALEVEGLEARSDKGLPALKSVSFAIRRGEILGLAGVAGNGQRELAEAITGLRRATAGRVAVDGRDITNCTPRQAIQAGVSHVPGDRVGVGLVPNLPISDNLALKAYRRPPLAKGLLLDYTALGDFARKLVQTFNIIAPSVRTEARLLSGGNQQKVVLAREIEAGNRVLIAVHPTRGLDVGAAEAVRRMLLQQRDEGAAILLISEDLDELMQMSDSIAAIFEGQIMGVLPADQADVETLGLQMAGEGHRVRQLTGVTQ